VPPLVVLHVPFRDEALGAERALELLLPRVGPVVLHERALVLVLLPATWVRANLILRATLRNLHIGAAL
jgi:hypothetical protein